VTGLKLRAVTPFTILRSKHHFYYGAPKPKRTHGLELVYGPPSYRHAPSVPTRINIYGKGPRARTRFTTVYEVPQAPNVYPWSTVPADSVEVRTGLTTLGNRIVHTPSIGYLKKRASTSRSAHRRANTPRYRSPAASTAPTSSRAPMGMKSPSCRRTR